MKFFCLGVWFGFFWSGDGVVVVLVWGFFQKKVTSLLLTTAKTCDFTIHAFLRKECMGNKKS